MRDSNSDANFRSYCDIHSHSYSNSYRYRYSYSYGNTDGHRHGYRDSDGHRDSDCGWNGNPYTYMRATDGGLRGYHDVNRRWLGPDQSQHGGRVNQLVPG